MIEIHQERLYRKKPRQENDKKRLNTSSRLDWKEQRVAEAGHGENEAVLSVQ